MFFHCSSFVARPLRPLFDLFGNLLLVFLSFSSGEKRCCPSRPRSLSIASPTTATRGPGPSWRRSRSRLPRGSNSNSNKEEEEQLEEEEETAGRGVPLLRAPLSHLLHLLPNLSRPLLRSSASSQSVSTTTASASTFPSTPARRPRPCCPSGRLPYLRTSTKGTPTAGDPPPTARACRT